MDDRFSRNELFWGKEFQKSLKNKHIAVFGLGGVGGFALEALARSGVENFTIVDFDCVDISNINRQLIALNSATGKKKTDLWQERLKDINPNIKIIKIDDFYSPEIFFENKFDYEFDYVVDAIDTLKSKIGLIKSCIQNKIPVISSFGAGNRINPEKLYITQLENYKPNCSFSKNVVSKLKKEGIEKDLTIVVSSEKPHSLEKVEKREKITLKNGKILEFTKFTPASTPFVAPVCGYLIASYIVRSCLNV